MYVEIAFVKSTKRFEAVLTKYIKTTEDSDTSVNNCFENNKQTLTGKKVCVLSLYFLSPGYCG